MLHFEWMVSNICLKRQAPIAQMPGGPGVVLGGHQSPHLATMSRCQVRCWRWLLAVSCMRPPCAIVASPLMVVDPSSLGLALVVGSGSHTMQEIDVFLSK